MIETIRMNLQVLETAHAAGDVGTAKKCADTLPGLMKGLREVLAGGGVVFDSKGVDGYESSKPAEYMTHTPDRQVKEGEPFVLNIRRAEPLPAIPPPAPVSCGACEYLNDRLREQRQGFDRQTAFYLSTPAVDQWLRRVHHGQWTFGVLVRLTWATLRCAAALVLYGFRGRR